MYKLAKLSRESSEWIYFRTLKESLKTKLPAFTLDFVAFFE